MLQFNALILNLSEDTRKIQTENKDKINKKELERMQREKTAQNGNVFARQHEEMDKQLDKEVLKLKY